tara:strand:- start:809 stop:1072 length:264 start_codon:yes stop_codon:yes gene_type:complete
MVFPVIEGKRKRRRGGGGGDRQLDGSGYDVLSNDIRIQDEKIEELRKDTESKLKESNEREEQNLVLINDMEEDIDLLMRYQTLDSNF